MNSRPPLAGLAAIAILRGCAGPASLPQVRETTERHKAQIERLSAAPPAADSSPVRYSEGSWIAVRRIERAERDFGRDKADQLQIEVNQQFSSLNDVSGAIAALTGLPVLVGADVLAPGTSAAAPAAPPLQPPLPMAMPGGGPLPPGFPPPALRAPPPPPVITAASPIAVNYSGSLTGLMNLVAAYYGVHWKTNGASLRFFLLDSRTFRIAALPGDTRLSSSVDTGVSTGAGAAAAGGAGGGAGGGSHAGSTSNSSGVTYSGLSVWAALEASVRQMLGAAGKVVASPATGTITVTDTPAVLERVADFIEDQNRSLNRQVSVMVRVLSVELNEGESYGIQWDLVYRNLAAHSPYAIGFKSAATSADGVGNLVLSAPSSAGSRWAGTQAMISALSTQGRVTELTSATVVTLNNQAVPVNVGRRLSYLASSTTSQTANVGSSTSLVPGTVSTGFSMTLVPHIMDGKELLLQYSLDLSSLLQMKTISSGGNTIEAPDISTSSFIQRVRLQSSETLVVAGFDQDNLSAVAEGVGHPQNTLLGKRNGSEKRTMLVILIQPTVAP
jgi:type IVB pilus formation R64 PilN family outer membrane protein